MSWPDLEAMTPMPLLDAVAFTVALVVGGVALSYAAADLWLSVSNWLYRRKISR